MKKTIQISAGRGPVECCWVVMQVMQKISKAAKSLKIKTDVVNIEEGPKSGTANSAILEFEGKELDTFLKDWIGTIQWIQQSKFRPNHKRKNWFVGIQEIEISDVKIDLKEKDLKYEIFRAGGPGGQHVNKVSTAIRLVHIPTGIIATATESRSQLQNKKHAKERLIQLLQIQKLEEEKRNAQSNWKHHTDLVRGNPVQVLRGK